MKLTKEIKVRKFPKDALDRIDVQARQRGYKSREAYLYDILLQLSLEELRMESEQKYKYLLNATTRTIDSAVNVMGKNNELYEAIIDNI